MKKQHNRFETADDLQTEFADTDVSDRLAHLPYLSPPGPTAIASRVQTLKSSVISAVEKRDRLPRQLFWSLFHTEIAEIKKRKARKRMLETLS